MAFIIGLNIVIGFMQEYSAEKTMDSLRSLSSPTSSVIRDGNGIVVPTIEVVPGDMVELKTGGKLRPIPTATGCVRDFSVLTALVQTPSRPTFGMHPSLRPLASRCAANRSTVCSRCPTSRPMRLCSLVNPCLLRRSPKRNSTLTRALVTVSMSPTHRPPLPRAVPEVWSLPLVSEIGATTNTRALLTCCRHVY